MKLAFSTNAFKRFSLEDSIRQISETGYTGVEILCDVPHAYPPLFGDAEALRIRDVISSCGLQISNLNAFTLYAVGGVYHPSWIDAEPARQARISHTINCIELARKLGARNISTEPGGPVAPGVSAEKMMRLFAESLAPAQKAAEREGIKLLVEPEPGLLIENSNQFRKLMKDMGPDYLGLNFDIGHFYCVNEDPASLVHELADYIGHFHLADIRARVHQHLVPGTGEIDFRPVFAAMEQIGYDGFVTVELYPFQDRPLQAAQEAYRHLWSMVESVS